MHRAAVLLVVACSSSSAPPNPPPSPAPTAAPAIDAAPPIDAPPPVDAMYEPRLNGGGSPTKAPPEPTPPGRLRIARVETTTPDAKLTKERVADKVSSAYFSQLKRCYRAALAGDPSMRGLLKLPLDIAPDGTARAHDVTFVDASVASCASALVAKWRFPSPGPNAASYVVHVAMLPE